jgi:hypothetical protein
MAANIGAERLRVISSDSELAAKGGDVGKVTELLPNLSEALDLVIKEIATRTGKI